jgi:hypothetical protein
LVILEWSAHDRVRFEQCEFVDCTFDFGALDVALDRGREFVVAGSTVTGGVIDLRGPGEYGVVLSLRKSRLADVTFAIDQEPVEDQVKLVDLTDVELDGTVLPQQYARSRSTDSA